MVLTPGRSQRDHPDDKLILQILANTGKRPEELSRAPRLSTSSSLRSVGPPTAQRSPAASLRSSVGPAAAQRSPAANSLLRSPAASSSGTLAPSRPSSAGPAGLPRSASAADLGVLCYHKDSISRRTLQARLKSWRAGPQKGMMRIKVGMASGLQAADLNGYSDPYCVVHCGGRKRKTRIIKRSLAPVWNETFEIRGWLDDFLTSGARFDVFDYDEVGMDDNLGGVQVTFPPELRVATDATPLDYFVRLTPQGLNKTISKGMLAFTLTWLPDEPRQADAPPVASSSQAWSPGTTADAKPDEDDSKVRKVFDKYDVDKSGTMDVSELRDALKSLGFTVETEQVRGLLKTYDTDGTGHSNGMLEFEEFKALVDEARRYRDAALAALKARIPIPVLLPHKFDFVRDRYGKSKPLPGPTLANFEAAVFKDKSEVYMKRHR